MSTHKEGVNPLRPYYIPPTIGEPSDAVPAASARSSALPRRGGMTQGGSGGVGGGGQYASRAREVFSDLDYHDYLGDASPSMVQNVKDFIDELLWKYTSVLMAQPFEVAKTILQVRDQDPSAALAAPTDPEAFKLRSPSYNRTGNHEESDSDAEEPDYFTSAFPANVSAPQHSRGHSLRQESSPLKSPRTPKQPAVAAQYLNLARPDNIGDVISQLWSREGAWGVWKGSNATFLYTVLQSLIENWSRSFLSAICNVPDLGVKDDIDRLIDIASPYPWASLFVAGTAAVTTGLLLAPLDLIRTRLIMTPGTHGQRRTLSSIRALPSCFCPSKIAIPTILHSLVHPLLTLSTPLVLRTRFLIDSHVSPMAFSMAKFLASSVAIAVKLPIETVLRRGQMSVLYEPSYVKALSGKEAKLEPIVPVGRYDGVLGTMYHITSEEGRRTKELKSAKKGKARAKTLQPATMKGQGLAGLCRGWKVSWWGLVGLWTASVVGNGGEGEF